MAKAKKAKAVASSASVHKKISSALESLAAAWNDAEAAVAARSKAAKKAGAEVKKLSKKRATLMKRKKTATAKNKKDSTGETRKALKTVAKDIAATKKILDKAKIEKSVHAAELAALKAGHRVATAYTKVIEKADKILNKPKKKRRKKRAKKAA
ncbi:hypothetical protein [Sulfuriflexus mobilis]|uniref:hypothetical protein n=1 Tax=Sulfuriflexus mobilis TaxID=1811807 RepID=UPI000F8280BE|nr:hypothetical protein [Sulfuriflexus mobilis]